MLTALAAVGPEGDFMGLYRAPELLRCRVENSGTVPGNPHEGVRATL